jgi:hypothetical protein
MRWLLTSPIMVDHRYSGCTGALAYEFTFAES